MMMEKLVRGSGNVFRDFGDPDAELEQTRTILASAVINVLDAGGLSVRAAERLTGVAASEFSRIRNVRLARFTIDRMIAILGKLGQQVEITVKVRLRREQTAAAPLLSGEAQPSVPSVGTGIQSSQESARAQVARRPTSVKVTASSRRKSRP